MEEPISTQKENVPHGIPYAQLAGRRTIENENKRGHVRARTAQNSNSSQSREYQTKKRGNRICLMKSDNHHHHVAPPA